MPFLEFITGIVSAVVGAVAGGIVKFFMGRRPQVTNVSITTPTLPVFVAAPRTLVDYHVPLTSETREILEIPRRTEVIKPPLIVPGEGIVSPRIFLDHAMDSLLIRANEPVECVICPDRKKWYVGAFINNHWYCGNHLKSYLESLASGQKKPFNSMPIGLSPWNQVESILTRSKGPEIISTDPTLRALLQIGTGQRSCGEFNEFWIEHNIRDRFGQNAMKLHFSFTIRGYRDAPICATALFFNDSGLPLIDTDKMYRVTGGQVAANTEHVTLTWNEEDCEDWTLTMPYLQLHQSERGTHKLNCCVGIFSQSHKRYLLWSKNISFSWTL